MARRGFRRSHPPRGLARFAQPRRTFGRSHRIHATGACCETRLGGPPTSEGRQMDIHDTIRFDSRLTPLVTLLESVSRPGGVLHPRPAVRADAAHRGERRAPTLVSGSAGAGRGPGGRSRARALRQGTGNPPGRRRAQPLAVGPRPHSGGRTDLEAHLQPDPGADRRRPRIPVGGDLGAVLHAAIATPEPAEEAEPPSRFSEPPPNSDG